MFVSSFPRHTKNVGTRIYKVLGVTENLFIRQNLITNIMYWCIKLSEEIQHRVMKVFNTFFTVPAGWTKHCDHITLIHSSNEHWFAVTGLISNFLGKSIDFNIIGVGHDKNVMALEVSAHTANERAHITICTAPGHKPVESNDIKNWEKLYCADKFSGIITLES